MVKFRIPRKEKKNLKGVYLYPSDGKGNSLMARPKRNQKDYTALKSGLLRDLGVRGKKKSKVFLKEIYVSDEELMEIIKTSIRPDLIDSFFNRLTRAKNDHIAKKAYFDFIQSYDSSLGDSFRGGNPFCYDLATALLKKSNDIKRRKKGKRVRKFGKISLQN